VKRIAVLGGDGMLGSMVVKVLKKAGVDVKVFTRKELDAELVTQKSLDKLLFNIDCIINCIGIINKYITDNDSIVRAIKVNSLFPYMLSDTGIPVIQIATDCAGELDPYGMTKKLGEVEAFNFCNIRCSIIGPGNKDNLLDWFLSQKEVKGFAHHFWNGVTTLAFAKLCLGLIDKERLNEYDQFNFVPLDYVSKYELFQLFKKYYKTKTKIDFVSKREVKDRVLPISYDSDFCDSGTSALWHIAGYGHQPTIEQLIKEMKEYK